MNLYKYIPYNPKLKNIASQLRKNQTNSEDKVWKYLKNTFPNLTFNRQKPLGEFIADFYNSENLIVLEIDGKIHEDSKERDVERDRYFLDKFNIKTIRFLNEEIAENVNIIAERLRKEIPSLTKEG